jgi:hypothetical protein
MLTLSGLPDDRDSLMPISVSASLDCLFSGWEQLALFVFVTGGGAVAVGVPIPVFTPEPGGRWFGGVSASCGVGEDQFTGSSGVVVGVGEAPAALVDDVVVR